MALRPALRASASGCSACRSCVLRLFMSPPTTLAPPAPFRGSSKSPATFLSRSYPNTARLYSSETISGPRNESGSQDISQLEDQAWEEELLGAESVLENSDAISDEPPDLEQRPHENTANEDVEIVDEGDPWYLKEEPPRHPTLVPELQDLPKAPKNSPAILTPLIQYIAEEAGLDDLNLMDLRALDPPAALGPSLIMLFGTARSERHLHVAANGFKSWLRKHGINAHADGLLGRNELKIRLRRRQRKAKLLGTSAPTQNSEEGLSTRWVCVNLGTIGSAQDSDEVAFQAQDGTLRGFGTQRTGTTIVVQMMTESKRQELGLETLWSRILTRRGDRNVVEDDLEYSEANAHPNELSIFQEGSSDKTRATPSQRRFFSTSCRRLSPHAQDSNNSSQVIDPPTSTFPGDSVDTSLDPVKFLRARTAELQRLKAGIDDLTDSKAAEALGPFPGAQAQAFLTQWNQAIEFLPSEKSWQYRVWLAVRGRSLGLPSYPLSHLRDLVEELQLCGTICQRSHCLDLLRAVYMEPVGSTVPLSTQSDVAKDILNVMFERGEAILATDVLISLLESLACTPSQSKQTREIQTVLEKLMLQADLPYMGEDNMFRLLDVYNKQGNWDQWWELWRMPPKHLQPRSDRLYAHMWATMAAIKDRAQCRAAIRECYNEMINENPPVKPIGQVKKALEACLRVADPDSEARAKKLVVRNKAAMREAQFEFTSLWRGLNPSWGTTEHI